MCCTSQKAETPGHEGFITSFLRRKLSVRAWNWFLMQTRVLGPFVWHSAQQAPHGLLCFAEENIVPPYWCRLGKVGLYRKRSLRQAGGFFMWVEQIHLPWGETQCWHLHVHPSTRCLLQAPPRHVGISLSSVPSPGTVVFSQCRSFTAGLAMFQGFLHWGVWSGGCYLFKRGKATLALLWNTTRAGCYFVKQQPGYHDGCSRSCSIYNSLKWVFIPIHQILQSTC